MKNFAFRSLSLLCVVAGLVSLSAQAEQVAPIAAAPTTKDADAAKIQPTAYVLGRYALYDTTRKSNFDFVKQVFRLGVNYSQGMFYASGEAEFEGNTNGQGPVDNSSSTATGGSTSVRQAFIGANFLESEQMSLGVTLGRFIPVGANMYGNDAITGQYSLSGFMPLDGVMLQFAGNHSFGHLSAQFAVVNNIPVWAYSTSTAPAGAPVLPSSSNKVPKAFFFPVTSGSSSIAAAGNGFSTPSTTSRKGYVGNVSAIIDVGPGKLEGVVAAASQSRAVLSQPTSTSAATARDVNYVEASLGYNYQNTIKGGMWFSYLDLSDIYSNGSDNNGGSPTFALPGRTGTPTAAGLATINPRDQYTQFGLGLQGNSKFLGMTNILAKDDALTAAFGFQQFMHRQNGGIGGMTSSDAKNSDVSMLSTGIGYVKGPVNFELNYAYFFSSSSDVFLNEGQNSYTNTAHTAYLSALYTM